jgi:hypothetical protein
MKLKNFFKKEVKKTVATIKGESMRKTQLGKVLGGGGGTATPPPAVDSIALNSSRSNVY